MLINIHGSSWLLTRANRSSLVCLDTHSQTYWTHTHILHTKHKLSLTDTHVHTRTRTHCSFATSASFLPLHADCVSGIGVKVWSHTQAVCSLWLLHTLNRLYEWLGLNDRVNTRGHTQPNPTTGLGDKSENNILPAQPGKVCLNECAGRFPFVSHCKHSAVECVNPQMCCLFSISCWSQVPLNRVLWRLRVCVCAPVAPATPRLICSPALDIAWSRWLWRPCKGGRTEGRCSQYCSLSGTRVCPMRDLQETQTYCAYKQRARTNPHHFSIIRSNTRLTFRSESRLKSDPTNGAAGGVRGRRPDERVSSQSAASNAVGARRLRDFPLDGRGEVQMGGGGGGGAAMAWLGFITAGDGGSSSRREEHRGEGRKPSLCSWESWDWSPWEGGGEGPGTEWGGDLWSQTFTEPGREVVKRMRPWKKLRVTFRLCSLLIMWHLRTQVMGSSRMSSMDCRGSICGQKKHLNPTVLKEF